jgi:hypothetical protein
MVTVVIINILISLMLLYVAWRLWKIKLTLKKVTNALIAAERNTHSILVKAPDLIYARKRNILSLRQSTQNLESQIQQVRQIIGLLLSGTQWWQRYSRNRGVGGVNKQNLKKA